MFWQFKSIEGNQNTNNAPLETKLNQSIPACSMHINYSIVSMFGNLSVGRSADQMTEVDLLVQVLVD